MWPISSLRDWRKKSQEDKTLRERDRYLALVNEGIDTGNVNMRASALCSLCRYADMPDMPGIAKGIVDRLEQKEGLKEALHTSIYLMNCMHNETVHAVLAENTFRLVAQADKKDEGLMASSAMAANLIAEGAPKGSDLEKRGMDLWLETVNRLATTSSGIQYAFAAASNAALGQNKEYALRPQAIETWYKIVTDFAKKDPTAAYEEARRVLGNYDSFGDRAKPFKLKASEALNKFAFGG